MTPKTLHSGAKMKLNKTQNGDTVELTASGAFDFDDHSTMRSTIAELQDGDATKIQMTMTDVTSVDSAAIGLLLMAHDRLKKSGKSFAIKGAQGLTERALRHAKVDEMIDMS